MNFIQTHVRTLYGLLFCVLLPALSQAQIMFERHYGGSGDETGNNVLQTSDGGYIVTGSTDSYGLGGRDIYIMKTDEYGNVVWSNTYGGSGDDQSTDIIATNDGNYVICGITDSYGAGGRDIYCIKLDHNGDTVWTRTYGGTGPENGCSIIQSSDNSYVIAGSTGSFSPVTASIYLIKTDENGDTIWTRTYYKQDVNTGYDVIETSDTSLLIGITLSNTLLTHDYMLIKTNIHGDTLWTKVYDKGGNDWAFSICEANNGDIMVSGVTNIIGAGGYDVFLSRYDNAGNELWFKTYGGNNDDWGGGVQKTNDSEFILVGSTYSFGQGIEDVYLIKTDSNGDTLWTKTYGGLDDDWGGSVKQTSDNGFIISGDSKSFGNGRETYLVKTSEEGVAGFEESITLKNNIRISPNPNDGHFTIEIRNNNENISCTISDIYGKSVYTKNRLFNGSGCEKISMPDLPAGLYFLNFTGKQTNTTTKLLIQK